MSEKIKLKEVFIHLVGFFNCSIENNTVLCSGIEHNFNNDEGETIAQAFRFDVFDRVTHLLPRSILVIFNQVKDDLLFLYGKDKYEVISISDDLIRLRKDGIDYTIEKTDVLV